MAGSVGIKSKPKIVVIHHRRRTKPKTKTKSKTSTNTARKHTKTHLRQKKPLVIRNNHLQIRNNNNSSGVTYHQQRQSLPPPQPQQQSNKSMSLHLSRASLDYATRLLNDNQEHGGSAQIGQKGELFLQEAQGNSRGQDHIQLPPMNIMWHTHPQTCKTKSNCGLGMPSSSDIERFIIDSMQACFVHMVFAHEGTYVIALKRQIRRDLARRTPDQQAAYAKNVAAEFTKIQKYYQENFDNMSYHQFSRKWMNFANANSIDVMFFGKGVLPIFTIRP